MKPNVILMAPWAAKVLLAATQPSRYALYTAGWRAGLTVNGLPPHG